VGFGGGGGGQKGGGGGGGGGREGKEGATQPREVGGGMERQTDRQTDRIGQDRTCEYRA